MGAVVQFEMCFVGRADEMAWIRERREAGSVGGVVLGGDAGVGKTRIAAEVVREFRSGDEEPIWLSSTPANRDVPFGVFAPLLGRLGAAGDEARPALGRVEALALAYDVIVSRLPEPAPLIVVDDGHQLDAGSAALCALLTSNRRCFLVLTVRTGEPLPAELEALWRRGELDQADIAPLAGGPIGEVCEHALGGVVDRRTRERLNAACRGNTLFLRELLRAGLDRGHLACCEGVWRWDGALAVTPRLSEVVEARFQSMGKNVVRLARLVALAEPLPLRSLSELCEPATIEAAEAHGVIVVTTDSQRRTVSLAHPLYGEVLRDRSAHTEMQRLAGELAAVVRAGGTRRDQDDLRLAMLELHSGDITDPAWMVTAAAQARSLGDVDLAERMARVAVGAGAGAAGQLELVECLFWQGRHEASVAVADGIDRSCLTPDEVVRLAVNLGSIWFFGRGDLAKALAVLDDAVASLGSDDRALRIKAHRAELLMFSGEVVEATSLARDVLTVKESSVVIRAVAYGALVPSLALAGLVDDAERIADESLAFLLAQREPPLADGAGIIVGRFLASLLGGRLDESKVLLQGLHDEAARRAADPMLGVWALMLGRAAVAAGNLPHATALLVEAAAQFRREDPSRLLSWALGSLAQAEGMRGHADAAAAAVEEMDATGAPALRAFGLDREVGRAWSLAAAGHDDAARRTAVAAARDAFSRGSSGSALYALVEAARLGAAPKVLQANCEPSPDVQGPLLPIAYEVCSTDIDATALLDRAMALHELHMGTWALDVAAIAARRAAESGEAPLARASLEWIDNHSCVDARTPALAGAMTAIPGAPLTSKERDIVSLVTKGLSNAQIADELVVSKRTVESHLGRVFRKLGVSNREDVRRLYSAD